MFKVVLWFDAQRQDIPKEAYDEIRELWADQELGNDVYYHDWEWEDGLGNDEDHCTKKYPNLAKFLEEQLIKEGLDKTYELKIHWWW